MIFAWAAGWLALSLFSLSSISVLSPALSSLGASIEHFPAFVLQLSFSGLSFFPAFSLLYLEEVL